MKRQIFSCALANGLQIQPHIDVGCNSSHSLKHRAELLQLNGSSRRKKKKKKKETQPVVDCSDRRCAIRAAVAYASTKMSVFLEKKQTFFTCKGCFKSLPNRRTPGLVATDRSSQPVCIKCSAVADCMDNIFAEWKPAEPAATSHPVALAMQRVSKGHRGQHGMKCAACVFLNSCKLAHCTRNMAILHKAMRALEGCSAEPGHSLLSVARAQARSRVRGRNNDSTVDLNKTKSRKSVLAVLEANARAIIERVKQSAGCLTIQTRRTVCSEKGLRALVATALAEKRSRTPMFVHVQTTSGRHLGVFVNEQTRCREDDTVRDKLDAWCRALDALVAG